MIKFENFKKVLTDNGVSDTRVAIMADAVNYLHTAINEMDQRQRENFLDVFGDVASLVNDFASAEGLNKIRARQHIAQEPRAWHEDENDLIGGE